MIKEIKTAADWAAQSETHARKMLKVSRHALFGHREAISLYEERIVNTMADINAVKRVMLENGWDEE